MFTRNKTLLEDLMILEIITTHISTYLSGEALVGPNFSADSPALTLGSYLMREHRLLALRGSLRTLERERLDAVTSHFDSLLLQKSLEFQQRACQELEVLLQQWHKYQRKLNGAGNGKTARYPVAVETRVMIEEILQNLLLQRCQLEVHLGEQMERLDLQLYRHWQPGKFVWPSEWQPAYPPAIYWWLYGQPKRKYDRRGDQLVSSHEKVVILTNV